MTHIRSLRAHTVRVSLSYIASPASSNQWSWELMWNPVGFFVGTFAGLEWDVWSGYGRRTSKTHNLQVWQKRIVWWKSQKWPRPSRNKTDDPHHLAPASHNKYENQSFFITTSLEAKLSLNSIPLQPNMPRNPGKPLIVPLAVSCRTRETSGSSVCRRDVRG